MKRLQDMSLEEVRKIVAKYVADRLNKEIEPGIQGVQEMIIKSPIRISLYAPEIPPHTGRMKIEYFNAIADIQEQLKKLRIPYEVKIGLYDYDQMRLLNDAYQECKK